MLRRRPIARMAVGTAVVAGTATAVSGRVASRQAASAPQAPPEAPAPAAPPVVTTTDPMQELKEAMALHDQGVLTDDEFAAQKARILG